MLLSEIMIGRKLRSIAVLAVVAIAGCGGGSDAGSSSSSSSVTLTATLGPNGLNFSTQNLLSTGATQTATFSNTGTAGVTITSINITGDFSQATNCPMSPATLAGSATCNIQVTFKPAATGVRSGTLTVNDNANGGSQSINLSGVGGAASFYVATNGNDSWSGTLASPNSSSSDGPFASIDHARAVIQGLNKTGLTQVTVQIRNGTYFLPPAPTGQTTSLLFTSADSGTSNTEIVYENYPNENPLISGGKRITGWKNAGGNVWTATLDPAKVAYFENLYYNGARRLRPRINGYLGGSPWLRVFGEVTSTASSDAANCPSYAITNKGKGVPNECFDRFYYCDASPGATASRCDQSPITNTWANLTPPSSNNPCAGSQPAGNGAPLGDIQLLDFEQFSTSKLLIKCIDTTNGIIYLTGPTAIPGKNNYTEAGFIVGHRYLIENVKDALTQPGQWFLDRSTSPWILTYLANTGEDPSSNNNSIVVPQLQQVMVANNLQYVTFRGLTFAHDNFTVYPQNPGTMPQGYVSSELEPSISSAVSFQNSQNILFDSDTVTQTSGNGIEVIACTSKLQSPSWCISPLQQATTQNVTVQNSAFYDLGANGIRIGEKTIVATDTDANVPNSILVQNNVVEGYGHTFPAAFGIGQGMGNHNTYTHNDVYDGYHCAISISENIPDAQTPGSGSSGDSNNTISYNHVYNLLQGIMNDGGAIRIENGNDSSIAFGNSIVNNKIHDVSDASIQDSDGYGGHGIYLDNSSGDIDVERNLVYRVSGATIHTPHGPIAQNVQPPSGQPTNANIVKNNIFAYAIQGMVSITDPYKTGNVPASPNQIYSLSSNIFYFDRDENSTSPFVGSSMPVSNPFRVQAGCTYLPGFSTNFTSVPYGVFESFNNNLYWRTDGAFASDQKAFYVQITAGGGTSPCSGLPSTWTFFSFSSGNAAKCPTDITRCSWQGPVGVSGIGEDPGSIANVDPWPSNPDPTKNDDYSSPNVPSSIGFTMFDLRSPGRSNAVIQPPAIPPTFPTQLFQQSDF